MFRYAWNYIPFFFLSMVNLSLIYNYLKSQDNKHSIRYIILSSVLSFIISGGNHVTAFMDILLLLSVSVFSIYKKKYWSVCPLLIAVAGFVIVLIAPGTAVRQSYFENPSVLNTMINSALYFCYLAVDWLDFKWIFTMAIATLFGLLIMDQRKDIHSFNPLLLLLISITILCGMICTPYYAMGHFGSYRIENMFWLAFTAFSLINWLNMMFRLRTKHISFLNIKSIRQIKNISFIFVILITALCFNVNSNSISIAHEILDGTAQYYAAFFDQRCLLMENSDDDEAIPVVSLPYSENLYFDDITSDLSDWRNQSWESYYGIGMYIVDISSISEE